MANGVLQSYNLLGIQGSPSVAYARILTGFLILLKLYELEQGVLGLLMQAIFHLLQPRFDGCQVAQTQNPLEDRSNFEFIAVHLLPIFKVRNKFLSELFL